MEEHPEARFIVDTLQEHGYTAYYAGGWVRDFLLKHPSDDIDIATSAPPEVIQTLFEKTVPIGICFGIILVIINHRKYEVATFRSDLEYKDGRKPSKIVFTTAEQDAKRRDFTINGMFYDPIKQKVIDFVGGKKDLEKKILRAIGDPHLRFKEDRLRMIRAIRLACRFHFTLEKNTQKAIFTHAEELFPSVSRERIWQELQKMSSFPGFRIGVLMLYHYGLLTTIFPDLCYLKEKQMEERVKPMEHLPRQMPTIAYILLLFEGESAAKKWQLCDILKLSNKEKEFILFWEKAEKLFQQEQAVVSRYEWAQFYAHPLSGEAVILHAAKLPTSERILFLEAQDRRKGYLAKEIERIQNKTPIITSSFLQKQGIKPGVCMGKLLKEAEEVSINQKIEDPQQLLILLKASPHWPTS